MRERLLRFGCWLNGHATIRPDHYAKLWRCRCGKRALSARAIHYRYRR